MQKYQISSTIIVTDYTYLFTIKVKPKDNKIVYIIYVVIINKVVDYIITNYIYTRMSIKTLISRLEEYFNSYIIIQLLYNKSLLFQY